MPVVEMICLANSRKLSGRCVAGVLVQDYEGVGSGWVRPVRNNAEHNLLKPDYTFADGNEAAPLDLIRLELERFDPKPHHPEDWIVSPKQWELVARPAPKERANLLLRSFLEQGPILGSEATNIAYADCIARQKTSNPQKSLALVWAKNPRWAIRTWESDRKTALIFDHNGVAQNLKVTDTAWEKDLRHLSTDADGQWQEFPVTSPLSGRITDGDNLLVTVSLSDPFNPANPKAIVGGEDGWCYKRLAGIIVVPDKKP